MLYEFDTNIVAQSSKIESNPQLLLNSLEAQKQTCNSKNYMEIEDSLTDRKLKSATGGVRVATAKENIKFY